MNGTLEEPDLLTEVPAVLKKLCKVVGHGFYESEQASVIHMLTNSKYPCVKEDDLIECLRFDRKQLRQAMVRLKNDKLVKQRTHKEKQAETGNTLSFNYFFINYKLFVNVVKYKLDHIRKKIESDERQAKNRPSFVCVECSSKYSDLEVDRLMDIDTGLLKCTTCAGKVEEDLTDIQHESNCRTCLALFNEQMEPIFKLLRECESINLAPSILEPEPQPIQTQVSRSAGSHGSRAASWATGSHGLMYDPGIKISMGAEDDETSTNKPRAKEAPIWMKQSTISSTEVDKVPEPATTTQTDSGPGSSPKGQNREDDILADLLVHEVANKKARLDITEALGKGVEQDESDSSDESESDITSGAAGNDAKGIEVMEQGSESEQEEDDHKVSVKGQLISISDLTNEMVEQMTSEERDAYQQIVDHYY